MFRKWITLLLVLLAVGCMGMGKTTSQGDAPRMEKEELKALLGSPDLILIDVRFGKDWSESDRKIVGAVREDPQEFDMWKGKYPKTKTLVLYCA
jgi:hypothetical protein